MKWAFLSLAIAVIAAAATACYTLAMFLIAIGRLAA